MASRAMRAAVPLLLAATLLLGTAAGWAARLEAPLDGDLSLTTSLLVAGAVDATSRGAVFGAPEAFRLEFGEGLTVVHCPDAAADAPSPCDVQNVTARTTNARLALLGGALVWPEGRDAAVRLVSPATAAALGGANLTVNRVDVGPLLVAGGQTLVTAEGDAFRLRPFGSGTRALVNGSEGDRTYTGEGYTLLVTGARGATLEATGAFLRLANGTRVAVTEAGPSEAEAGLRGDHLHGAMRRIVPPQDADRRADLVDAFGPFQTVPSLLDGAVASRGGLRANGETLDPPALVRLRYVTFVLEEGTWRGDGDARYVSEGGSLAARPGGAKVWLLLLPLPLLLGFVAMRRLGPEVVGREPRRTRLLLRGVAFLLLAFAAAWAVADVLGVSPILDAADLSGRSRLQLDVVAGLLAFAAYATVTAPGARVAAGVAAWRGWRPHEAATRAVGVVLAIAFLVVARFPLVGAAASIVRL